jgi:hypothetical protein
MLGDGRIRIHTSDKWIRIRIQEAQNIQIRRIRIQIRFRNTVQKCYSTDPLRSDTFKVQRIRYLLRIRISSRAGCAPPKRK